MGIKTTKEYPNTVSETCSPHVYVQLFLAQVRPVQVDLTGASGPVRFGQVDLTDSEET